MTDHAAETAMSYLAADQPIIEPSALDEALDAVREYFRVEPLTPSVLVPVAHLRALYEALAPAPQPAADLGDLTTWTPAEVAASPVGASRLIQRLDAMVTAVRELHSLHRATRLPNGAYEWSCDECGADLDSDDDTCATVRALDGGA